MVTPSLRWTKTSVVYQEAHFLKAWQPAKIRRHEQPGNSDVSHTKRRENPTGNLIFGTPHISSCLVRPTVFRVETWAIQSTPFSPEQVQVSAGNLSHEATSSRPGKTKQNKTKKRRPSPWNMHSLTRPGSTAQREEWSDPCLPREKRLHNHAGRPSISQTRTGHFRS